MYVITERDSIKSAIKNFVKTHGEGTYRFDKRGIMVGQELLKLDPDTCTSDAVNTLIGSDWTSRICNDCGEYVKEVICVGQEPDYESYTAYLCKDCLSKAYKMFGE